MRRFYILSAFLSSLLIFLTGSCILVDYFSGYEDKNLAGHILLSEWTPSHGTPYMDYAEVTAAVAGTSGLPDTAALIYRLENENLFPDGDFEASTAGAAPNAAFWTGTGGTYTIRNSGHALNGNALEFVQANTEFLTFGLNHLLDSAYPFNTYVLRFNMDGNNNGDYRFIIDDNSGTSSIEFIPNVKSSSTSLRFPSDFTTVPQSEFVINNNDDEVFRINRLDSDFVQSGYIDDIRVVKSDQNQNLYVHLPYEDADRVDGLELLSGWYRFSIYVKADPQTGTGNRFNACAVTLKIESIDTEGLGNTSNAECFYTDDYSSFSEWTELYIDAELQITPPEDTSAAVISLVISPCCTVGGALGADAGSILISNPSLEFSPTSTF